MGGYDEVDAWREAHRSVTDTRLVRLTATYICWHLIGVDYLPHTLVGRTCLATTPTSLEPTLTL